jgi:hypothetical protein
MKYGSKVYFILLAISVLLFLLELIFKIKGAIGLALCVLSLYFFVGSIIKIIRFLQIVDDDFMENIDILFFL